MKVLSRISRVDIQVSILTAGIVIVSFWCVYLFNYTLTYRDMIYSLSERSTNIYRYMEDRLDKTTFYSVNSVADQDQESYRVMKGQLEAVKEFTGVMYLYTAKRRADGSFIYLVDGLDSKSPDFRNAGDVIEEEIWGEMEKALAGEIILPDRIMETTWGPIFISYFPIRDSGVVVGVLGIEFEANHQYKTFNQLRLGTPIIALLTCLIAVVIAVRLFKRISNPTFKDLATMDYLTRLKNRNAFEIDLHNLNNRRPMPGVAIISIDLNDLKAVNDTLGHQTGDQYIQSAAAIMQKSLIGEQVLYRVGGDEFIIVLPSFSGMLSRECAALAGEIEKNAKLFSKRSTFPFSLAIGYAVFDQALDRDLHGTIRRADDAMYKNKRKGKENANYSK